MGSNLVNLPYLFWPNTQEEIDFNLIICINEETFKDAYFENSILVAFKLKED